MAAVKSITSTQASSDLGAGNVVTFTVTMTAPVRVDRGIPSLSLNDGGVATYTGGSRTSVLTFKYTVGALGGGQNTSRLAVTGLNLNGAIVAGPTPGDTVSFAGLTAYAGGPQIDTVAPTVASVVANPGTADLGAGKTVTLSVNFSENVSVTGAPYLALNVANGKATYAGGSGSSTLTFTYVAAAGQNTADLAVTGLVLNGGTIRDGAGNSAVVTGAATNPTGILQIDTTAPAVSEVLYSDTGVSATDEITSNDQLTGGGDPSAVVHFTIDGVTGATTTAGSTGAWTYTPLGLASGAHTIVATETDAAGNTGAASLNFTLATAAPAVTAIATSVTNGNLQVGNSVALTVKFSAPVYATAAQYLQLNDNGRAVYTSGSGTNQLTFTYVVAANQSTSNLAVTGLSAGLTDIAGNSALLNGVTTNPGGVLAVGINAPAVTEGLYSDTGVSATDKITSNDELSGGGDPNAVVHFTIDGVTGATATATSTGAWTYTPAGLADGSHMVIASETNGAGNTGTATLNFTLDRTAPILTSVAANPANGDLDAGKTVTMTVDFNENVFVAGSPYLALNDNGQATYAGGSGSNAITFTYVVGAGQNTSELAVSNLMLNGATIRDAAGNNAVTTGATAPLAGTIVVDTVAPTVSSVVASGAGITAGSGTVGVGSVVTLTVNISEAVTVSGGTPYLNLNDGGTATYTGGSGTSALNFSYTVAAGQSTPDLTVTGLALNGATIQDGAGNNAVLTGAVTNPAGTLAVGNANTLAPTLVGAAGGLQINLVWDSSVASAPAAFQTAVEDAALLYTQLFTNPEVINIQVGYGEIEGQSLVPGALAESDSNGYLESYANVAAALRQDAASSSYQATADASLPASDPTNGGQFYVSSAQAKAWGQVSGSATGIDGDISLSSQYSFDFTPGTPISAGQFDAIGTMEHEISEVMGRVGSLGALFSPNWYTPLDLFRYSSSGVRDLTPGPGYFSIDHGATNLGTYNNPVNGGDASDWIPSLQGDSYGDGYPGIAAVVSPNDIIEDSVLGYTMSPLALADTATTGLAIAPRGATAVMATGNSSAPSTGTAVGVPSGNNLDLVPVSLGAPVALDVGTRDDHADATPSLGKLAGDIARLNNYLAQAFAPASAGHGGALPGDILPVLQTLLAPPHG